MATAATHLTLDDFLALPEEKPYREYLRGEVTEKPMPNQDHGKLVAKLIIRIGSYLEGTGEGDVVTEVRHAARDEDWVYLPDINVVLKGEPHVRGRGAVEHAPAFAIEVLSPDDRVGRTAERIDLYFRAGTRLVWLVDPELETITVYRPDAAPSVHRAPEVIGAQPVFANFGLDIAALFAVLQPAEG